MVISQCAARSLPLHPSTPQKLVPGDIETPPGRRAEYPATATGWPRRGRWPVSVLCPINEKPAPKDWLLRCLKFVQNPSSPLRHCCRRDRLLDDRARGLGLPRLPGFELHAHAPGPARNAVLAHAVGVPRTPHQNPQPLVHRTLGVLHAHLARTDDEARLALGANLPVQDARLYGQKIGVGVEG